MIRFFVKHQITTTMLVLFFMVLGIVSFFNLRLEKNPKIDFPIITVETVYSGATPLEVETSVTNKIEDAISELSGIEEIRSQSYENFGFVFVEFLLSSDVNIKFIEVKDKVEALLNEFPAEVDKPVITKYDPLVEPVMTIVLQSDVLNETELYELADKKVKDKFAAVKGVANVDIAGGRERQINVVLDPILMQKNYVDIRDVVKSVTAKNKNIPGGLVEKGDFSMSLRFVGEFDSLDDIAEMLIVSRDGSPVRLKDIAFIEDGAKKVETIARYQGKNVIALSLQKVSDGNAVNISSEVRKRFQGINESLPEGTKLTIATDTTSFIVDEMKDAQWAVFLGILLTIIILYLFTGNLATTFIASIVIPMSIVSSFLLVDFSGFSINFLTILSVSTALGTLIANAIVIIESCLEHIQKGENIVDAVVSGTMEVFVAVFASTGTNLVVFAPLAFMGGIVGKFMSSFGLTVIYVTIFSLLISFTLTPMLCAMFLKKHKKSKRHKWSPLALFSYPVIAVDKAIIVIKKEYSRLFSVIFRFPKMTVLLVFLSISSTWFILPYVGSDFNPTGDEDIITLGIALPQGFTIEKTLEAVEGIESHIKDINEVESCFSKIGENGVENAKITINLCPLNDRDRGDIEIIEELVVFMAQISDMDISIARGAGGLGGGGDLSTYIYGSEFDEMIDLSMIMRKTMEDSGFFRSVTSSYHSPKNEIRFTPDQESLIKSGVSDVEIGSVMRASVYGDTTNIFKEAGFEYDINVKLDDRYIEDFDDIKQINVITRKGLIPIVELGDLKRQKAMPMITHHNKQRGIQLEGYLAKSTLGHVKTEMEKAFKKIDFKEGYGYVNVGNAESQDESSMEILKAFSLAVILTYMLLAAVMNSLFYPIPIILSIAASFSGVFYSLFFMGETINVASMLGFVMLVGLVVNNSILLLDFAIQKMKEGMSIKDALWEGSSQRFKPIIMTSIAIILGVLPQLFSIMPVKSSMGAVMVGGMLASILFTFLLTPVIFWYTVRFQQFIVRLLGRKEN